MGIEENKALVLRIFELYNQREVDAADEIYAPGCFEDITWEQNRQFELMVANAFPDMRWTISDVVAEGDRVAFIDNVAGTHTGGPFMGIPSTGKKIEIKNTYIVRIADGKVVELKGTFDTSTLWQQLGVLPTIPEAIQAYKESHNLE